VIVVVPVISIKSPSVDAPIFTVEADERLVPLALVLRRMACVILKNSSLLGNTGSLPDGLLESLATDKSAITVGIAIIVSSYAKISICKF
jgi:hypothetical protein